MIKTSSFINAIFDKMNQVSFGSFKVDDNTIELIFSATPWEGLINITIFKNKEPLNVFYFPRNLTNKEKMEIFEKATEELNKLIGNRNNYWMP